MRQQWYSPVNDARQNATRKLYQKYPKAFEIRFTHCEACGSTHMTSFLLPDRGLTRYFYCTSCNTFAGNKPPAPAA